MDYKIKFEYKGIGKQAQGVRQKVLQAQRSAEKKGGALGGDKGTITAIKSLNSSITKLIASNKQLSMAISRGGGGGQGVPGTGGGSGGGGAGVGRVGASLGVIGAPLALAGFAMQKVNQIGKAYMALAGQQKGSAGTGGFRTAGRGMYLAGDVGAGMKSYAQSTGKFEYETSTGKGWTRGTLTGKNAKSPTKTRDTNITSAIDVGSIYGLSASETLGQAGTFKRAGANYGQTAKYALGSGIQSELPTLLSGMAGIMEESIKKGMDATEMSRDLGKGLVQIARGTESGSMDAAISAIKTFQGVQKGVAKGKYSGMTSMYTAQASRKMMLEDFQTKEGREKFAEKMKGVGLMDAEERKSFIAMKSPTISKMQGLLGGGGSHAIEKYYTGHADPTRLKKNMYGIIKGQYGDSSKGLRRYLNTIQDLEGTEASEVYQGYGRGKKKSAYGADRIGSGTELLTSMTKNVMGGSVGMSTKREQRMQGLQFKYGAGFAKTTEKMDKAMIKVVQTIAGGDGKNLVTALDTMSTGVTKAASLFENLSKSFTKKNFKKAVLLGIVPNSLQPLLSKD